MSSTEDYQQNSEEQKFLALFPDILESITSAPLFSNVPEIKDRVKELIAYTSMGGEKTRGLMTVLAYRAVEKDEHITEESMRLARVLGWCVELFQTSLVILDDMADNAETRRGVPCWYRRPDVGLLAVNDSLLLLTLVFDLLKHHFGERECYPDLLYVFKEALSHLCIGQYPISPTKDYEQYTMDNFNKYSHYKRTYYTFKLPVYTSLLLAGKSYKDAFRDVEDILSEMGILITMQNDYMDCYVDEEITGKPGNDIQEGKCTWLAVLALQRCSDSQRAIFIANYGSPDHDCVQRIKLLYEDLQLQSLCQEIEKDCYYKIVSRVKALPPNSIIPSHLLLELFEMVYQMKID